MAIEAAFVVPHPPLAVAEVGQGEEKKIQATLEAYDAVAKRIAEIKPETILIASPHSVMYRNYFHISPGEKAKGSLAQFRAPQVQFFEEYDAELSGRLNRICEEADFPAGFEGEREAALDHGTMVPLYFIRKRYNEGKIVRMGLAGLPLLTHKQFGNYIRQAVEELDRRAVFVASGDLSHCQKKDGPYGYAPAGPEYDARLMETLKKGKLSELFRYPEDLLEASMECGHRAFCMMAGALEGTEYTTQVLSHEATFGVGYGVAEITVERPAE
ncbi:AmmeMemoRadiSam system protein B [Lachnospiraceae bacterium XBB1006]|nr:AmmeMemoRadiSam system protein B [Lachnospiraceae bacterium XBB1006]